MPPLMTAQQPPAVNPSSMASINCNEPPVTLSASMRKGAKPANCPKVHWYSFHGNEVALMESITKGDNLNQTISLKNQRGNYVAGVTPLFLAAQNGQYNCAQILVQNGADPTLAAFLDKSTELCSPAEVANLNGHMKIWWYLKKAEATAKGIAELAEEKPPTEAELRTMSYKLVKNLDLRDLDPADDFHQVNSRLSSRIMKKLDLTKGLEDEEVDLDTLSKSFTKTLARNSRSSREDHDSPRITARSLTAAMRSLDNMELVQPGTPTSRASTPSAASTTSLH